MKHMHFDVETAGFYGAYWACAGGADRAVIAMIGDDPEDRLARSAAKWLCGRGVNVLTMSPGKKDYGHHNYPLERIEAAISWLKANGSPKIGIAGASTTGTLALTAASIFPWKTSGAGCCWSVRRMTCCGTQPGTSAAWKSASQKNLTLAPWRRWSMPTAPTLSSRRRC